MFTAFTNVLLVTIKQISRVFTQPLPCGEHVAHARASDRAEKEVCSWLLILCALIKTCPFNFVDSVCKASELEHRPTIFKNYRMMYSG